MHQRQQAQALTHSLTAITGFILIFGTIGQIFEGIRRGGGVQEILLFPGSMNVRVPKRRRPFAGLTEVPRER